ncbi:MAG: glycosyltransferase family 1 protein [Alphaproteobacteria bacterium]|nr:MAG: glycosyltransferase family 1 protein [Alphaproteobacteria bacterium]
MRIGFEAKRATHKFRGLGNYSRGLIEGLLEYSPADELFLYTPPINSPRGAEWVKTLSKKAHLKLPQNYLETKFATLWRSFLLHRDLEKDNLDIFHGLSHEIPYGLKGAKSFKKMVTMHDLIYLRYPDFFPLIDRVVYNQKFKYACKNSDTVIAICQQTKDDLINFLGVDEKKIVVHYQSCSPLFYETLDSTKILSVREKYQLHKPFILNVGAFEERKNQLTLLESFAKIAEIVEEDLVFIGQGKNYKEQLEKRVKELKLSHRVRILNSVTFDELPAIYQAAKLFCFPSLFEGFGIPIIEALFSKIPVITSFGSCFPESAGPDSYFVDPLSEVSISEGLVKVLGDEKLQKHMSSKGLEYVQRFHRRETTSHLRDIYTQALN